MPDASGNKGKKKGFFALLKESVVKSNEGCGPGCGCHAENKKAPAKDAESAKAGKKA